MVWILSGVAGGGRVERLGFWGVLFFVVMVWVLSDVGGMDDFGVLRGCG